MKHCCNLANESKFYYDMAHSTIFAFCTTAMQQRHRMAGIYLRHIGVVFTNSKIQQLTKFYMAMFYVNSCHTCSSVHFYISDKQYSSLMERLIYQFMVI